MNRNSNLIPYEEKNIDDNISDPALEESPVEQMGDGAANDDQDESHWESHMSSALAMARGAISILCDRALNLSIESEDLSRSEDLEEIILLHRQALDLRPTSNFDRSTSLNDLANALWKQFTLGRRGDLKETISLFREALELRPASHPDRSLSLSNLANVLIIQFQHSGRREDLEEAISFYRQTLELLPPTQVLRSRGLAQLGNALLIRFIQSGRDEDLAEIFLLFQELQELRPAYLTHFAIAEFTKYEESGRLEDLEEAILLHRQALDLRSTPHPDRYMSLHNLGTSLCALFVQSGRREDLEEGILFHRQALELLPPSHPRIDLFLSNLALALRTQFEQSGRREHLEEAILLQRQTLNMRPASHPDRSKFLNNLASAARIQFEQFGRPGDLEEAVVLHREAIELLPASHPDLIWTLNNLAMTLHTRFSHSAQLEDLEETISLHRKAIKLQPTSHPLRFRFLSNLGNSLWTQFRQSGRGEFLEEAILLHRQAVELLPPSNPNRSIVLNNLGAALLAQVGLSGRLEDLDKAIVLHREAVEILPPSHPQQSIVLSSLASALVERFMRLGRLKDLEEAIDVSCQSLDALVSGHPLTCVVSNNQAQVYSLAYFHTKESQYLDKAIDSFRVAVKCEAASTSGRFQVAKEWVRLANFKRDSSLDAYHAAIELLPRLAMLGLDLPSRQLALRSGSDGLARAAAACAIRSGHYDKAVELLEEGRAVFWSQALQLRAPLTDLRDAAPELAEKLRSISLALEQGSLRDASRSLSDDTRRVRSMEQEASHFRRLNDEWLGALEEVRKLEGFQDFLRPRRISTLLRAADKGPLVILNASDTGCAVLILTLSGVQHVPLPALNFADLNLFVELIQIATAPGSRDSLLPESDRGRIEGLLRRMPSLSDTLQLLREPLEDRHMIRRDPNTFWQPDDVFRFVLGILWEYVVEPVIRQLGLQKSDTPSHLWWCPTGPFAFLPIHAAGMYHIKQPVCISDYVISSYTPTIGTLLRETSFPSTPFKMMVAIQPELPYTVDELQRIEARFPVTKFQTEVVRLVSGTVEEVASHLPTTSIAHFACHGTQDSKKPLESALLLHGRRPLTVHRIMQESSPNARLAFLAACQTAMGDKTLPDEMIHLGSTLLFAGFSGVVATMWNISDVDGPGVADTFYEYLFRETDSNTEGTFQPDTTRGARALHLAVSKLRSEKHVSFVRWVPFIHLGR